MKNSLSLALCVGVVLSALPGPVSGVPLTAGRVAKFKNQAGTASDKAILPLIGGQPISVLFPGGTGNCAATNDRDLGPGAVLGWYVDLTSPPTR